MSETRTEITDEELAEFTTRLSRLNTHMGREGGGLQEVAYRYLLRMVRRRAPGLPQDLAEAGADFRAAHARLFDLAQSQEEHRYLLGDTDILPGHADPALEHVAIPVQPGAVVRVGIPSQVFVRDSKGLWIGEHGALAVGDNAMRTLAAVRLEVLSEGAPAMGS